MLVNFKAETYKGLQYLAERNGKSVAAFVSQLADQAVQKAVITTYSMNIAKNEEKSPNA